MLLAEVNNPSGLKLTKSDTDGIFLHFDIDSTDGKQAGLRLDTLGDCSSHILLWAEKQFAKQQALNSLLTACKKVKRYKEWAENEGLNHDEGHDYWESVMSYVDVAIETAEHALKV